jgi:hypothetical protein
MTYRPRADISASSSPCALRLAQDVVGSITAVVAVAAIRPVNNEAGLTFDDVVRDLPGTVAVADPFSLGCLDRYVAEHGLDLGHEPTPIYNLLAMSSRTSSAMASSFW